MLDRDLSIEDALFSEISNENILFCEDNELYGVLFKILNDFINTKLDNVFYTALDICDECCLEEGNYRLDIIHSKRDVRTIKNSFKLLTEEELI